MMIRATSDKHDTCDFCFCHSCLSISNIIMPSSANQKLPLGTEIHPCSPTFISILDISGRHLSGRRADSFDIFLGLGVLHDAPWPQIAGRCFFDRTGRAEKHLPAICGHELPEEVVVSQCLRSLPRCIHQSRQQHFDPGGQTVKAHILNGQSSLLGHLW